MTPDLRAVLEEARDLLHELGHHIMGEKRALELYPRLDAAIRSMDAGQQYVMVPREPLMAMSEAGNDAVGDEVSGPGCHRIYVAMVKKWLELSAPQPGE